MLTNAPANAHSLAQTSSGWQQAMRDAIRDPQVLLGLLRLGDEWLGPAQHAAKLFGLRVPRGFVARMQPGDPNDPLLRQVLPLAQELETVEGYRRDAVGDLESVATGGVLRKYPGRALLITTGACAVHCRYCFRRHFPYSANHAARGGWQPALDEIAADASLREVILSGGDPLSLADSRLAALSAALDRIAHLKYLRIHSRTPVVLPERVDDALLRWLRASRLRVVMVIHANHAQELDASVAAALTRLTDAGVTLLNQSVLLRGVNDDPATLADLSKRLFNLNVLPYYLHLLDKVEGAAHFDVSQARAQELYKQLAEQIPGYLVPRLAREQPGRASKTLLGFDS